MSDPPARLALMSSAAPASESPIQGLDRSVAVIAAASAECLRDAAEIDERKLWERDGATSMSAWLAARYGLAWGTAREWVRVAHAIRGLPRIARAYARGEISWDQLRPLTKFASPETEEYWARKAPELRPSTLWREARRHERVLVKEAREVHRRRYLWLHWDPESPALYLQGMVGAEQGAALQAALERRAEEVVLEEELPSPGNARMADALVELVTGGASDQAPAATVVVHAGAEVLTGEEPSEGPWLSETESGQRLCTDAVRRLACDSRIEWVLESGGRPVGIGRRGRAVPSQIMRVLRHRDGGACRFPGCERKRWLHAHHLIHWAQGGATNLDNLVLLCHAHHRLIHEGGWRTSGHPARDLRFHDPTGRPLRRAAPEPRPLVMTGPSP
jgi:Domain of unknown function (DUF222)/HNH endonuclease